MGHEDAARITYYFLIGSGRVESISGIDVLIDPGGGHLGGVSDLGGSKNFE